MNGIVAWTGGTRPNPPALLSRQEWRLVDALFREQVTIFQEFWGDNPERDTLRIFYGRARHDAHATMRAIGETKAFFGGKKV